jgi:hypothetical protein
MDFFLDLNLKPLTQGIRYQDAIMLIGSCFTEHIGNNLLHHKFAAMQNPHGILFDPLSVSHALERYISGTHYAEADLFFLNEVWHSWHHHSRFSATQPEAALSKMNEAVDAAHAFLQQSRWLIITLGSSYSYQLAENQMPVANCHRAPAQWFHKHLLGTAETTAALQHTITQLQVFNPDLQIIFTISPVRHIRDGVVANNRSKSRLIEAVHQLTDQYAHAHYFPAYELVIDILRDYRFYDTDMVHPNYQATSFVMDKFSDWGLNPETRDVMAILKPLLIARQHKVQHPDTEAYRKFMTVHLQKVQQLQAAHPYLDLSEELAYFGA